MQMTLNAVRNIVKLWVTNLLPMQIYFIILAFPTIFLHNGTVFSHSCRFFLSSNLPSEFYLQLLWEATILSFTDILKNGENCLENQLVFHQDRFPPHVAFQTFFPFYISRPMVWSKLSNEMVSVTTWFIPTWFFFLGSYKNENLRDSTALFRNLTTAYCQWIPANIAKETSKCKMVWTDPLSLCEKWKSSMRTFIVTDISN